jgi:hypothetical protein
MNEESLRGLRTKLNDTLRAAERIATMNPQLEEQDKIFLSGLGLSSQSNLERITEIQGRICGPLETEWYIWAWSKVKNFPGLIIYRVTQLHSSSCIRATQIIPYPNPMSPVEFYTLLLALCLLFYASCGGIAVFYNFFPESSDATITTISTATNFTYTVPRTEPCYIADVVHPKEISSIIAIGFLVLIITFVLLLLFLKFVILLPWSIYYSSWLLMYLFIKAPILGEAEGQQEE